MLLFIVYHSYKEDGLNAIFSVLPAKFLIPVLVNHGAKIGKHVEMHTPITFHNVSALPGNHYSNLQIGDGCYLGKEVLLDLAEKINLEDQVTISMRVTILTHTHAGKSNLSQSRLLPSYAPVKLRRGCYIGAGAIILPGVEIGQDAIVGAGAVVTHSVLPCTTVVGVPARVIADAKFDEQG